MYYHCIIFVVWHLCPWNIGQIKNPDMVHVPRVLTRCTSETN
jgi:hypothetical protein